MVASLPTPSPVLRTLFIALTALVAAGFPGAVFWSGLRAGLDRSRVRRETAIAALLSAGWIGLTGCAAARGWLHFTPPPTMAVLFVTTFVVAIAFAASPLGRRVATQLPLAALVGFQVFRVGVEILMHRAFIEGLAPRQMTYTGRNFDIISGLTAAGVAAWLMGGGRSPRVVLAWNVLGTLLLANILGVALLSAPTPFRVFMNEPSNVWITEAPWVWLPAVMVLAAIAGHALIYRRLWLEHSTKWNKSGLRVLVFAIVGNVIPGGLFLYWVSNHMSLRAMLSDTLAVAFFIDLVMSMLFLSYLFARKPVGRVKWPWLVVATLLGTLAFGVPLFLWLNWRLLPRPRPDFDEWWRAA